MWQLVATNSSIQHKQTKKCLFAGLMEIRKLKSVYLKICVLICILKKVVFFYFEDCTKQIYGKHIRRHKLLA